MFKDDYKRDIERGGFLVFVKHEDLTSRSNAEKAIKKALDSKTVNDLQDAEELRLGVKALKDKINSP